MEQVGRRRRAEKVAADAIATNGPFDGITAQGGDTGISAGDDRRQHPFVPFRRRDRERLPQVLRQIFGDGLIPRPAPGGTGGRRDQDRHSAGRTGDPAGSSCRWRSRRTRTSKEGRDYFPSESDNFFVGNSFPTCGINFTAQEIMGQTKETNSLARRAAPQEQSLTRLIMA